MFVDAFFSKDFDILTLDLAPWTENMQMQGYTEIKSRSLLTSMDNHVTLLLESGKPIYTPS
jgi:hypothetical protein